MKMEKVNIEIKHFSQLSTTELYEIFKARFSVFVMEQQCFYLDMDDIDYYSTHLFIWSDKKVITYARLFRDSETNIFHIGRMLTTIRGKGYGKYLMSAAVIESKKQGASIISIDAQTHAIKFYEQLGFKVVSEEFIEAGIPHKKMELYV